MTPLDGIQKEYTNECIKLATKYQEKIEQELIKFGLFGLVKRVRDGKVGRLRVIRTFGGGLEINFYPLTKSGKESRNANGLVWSVDTEFEPVEENKSEN